MALDDHTAQAQLTPEERRGLLRAFADRMLLKITAMDDPADLPGVEKAMRVAAVIERVYSRCDRAERQIRDKTPDPRKLEAERAANEVDAIKARVSLANTLKWGEERRQDLGQWWDAAQNVAQSVTATPQAVSARQNLTPLPAQTANKSSVRSDVTDSNDASHVPPARTDPGLRNQPAVRTQPALQKIPIANPPLRGPPF